MYIKDTINACIKKCFVIQFGLQKSVLIYKFATLKGTMALRFLPEMLPHRNLACNWQEVVLPDIYFFAEGSRPVLYLDKISSGRSMLYIELIYRVGGGPGFHDSAVNIR
jgi:hypothetical protein